MRFNRLIDKLAFGKQQEARAARYLETQGLRLLQSNYYCRFGELDLIMSDGAVLVFVEVRFRRSLQFGDAAASVTPSKQQKLRRTAAHFLQHHPRLAHTACRFDVIGLSQDVESDQSNLHVDWIKRAFE